MDITMDNQQERLFNIGWLVGIIDGEGCFTLRKKKYSKGHSFFPTIQITNTNIKIIQKVKNILTDEGFTYYFYSRFNGKNKPYYRIEISGLKRVKKFLDSSLHLFECRQKQANKLYQYVNLRLSKQSHSSITSDEIQLAKELSELNE